MFSESLMKKAVRQPAGGAMFARRKQGLLKKAMELSVLCDCDVALIVFGPGSGSGPGGQRLYQYSSIEMDELLERYASAVLEPHERRRNGELLRHYYELSPDEDDDVGNDGMGDGDVMGDGTSTSAAARAAAAATMAAVDRIITGGGGRRDSRDDGLNPLKRMRAPSPGLGGLGGGGGAGLPSGAAADGGLPGGGGLGGGGPFGAAAPLRRVPMMGGGGLGPTVPLEGIKAAGFLDKRNYPVSPRSEKAYEEVTQELERLQELRRGSAQTMPPGLQPLSATSGAPGSFAFAAQQHQQHLAHLLQQHQQQHQQQGGGGKRFKPLSIMVPDNQAHPILHSSAAPHASNGAGMPSSSAAAARAHDLRLAGSGVHLAGQPHAHGPNGLPQHHQQQLLGLPPRPPGAAQLRAQGQGGLQQHPQGAGAAGEAGGRQGLGPSGAEDGSSGAAGGGSGPAPMDTDGGGASFAFDRRSQGGGDDAAGSFAAFASLPRSSLDGSTANLLSMPSPLPHGGAHGLFGSLDGGPLSMRTSNNGMLGLERGASMGMGLLESPGPMALDAALRGLAPMDVLDWPSSSPSRSGANSDAGGEAGGFASDDGDGGTMMDGLVVQGTALSKLPPEALEAAIGPSPDEGGGGGGTPLPVRGGSASTTAFASATSAAAAAAAFGHPHKAPGTPTDARPSPVPRTLGAAGGDGAAGPSGAPAGEGGQPQQQEQARAGAGPAPPHPHGFSYQEAFEAATSGLSTELSFNELHVGGSALAAAAAASVAAQQQQQREAQEEGGGSS
ncbi:Myocyte-specific enhancer factor 2B [Tetrabaena socialis]|uniref:Myocyte-specific enhancer factor 2B n=1 Tax=Tetrabaena socialis TaxID=47790 RepID=A0A2J8AEP8_9CHLO|nr:Myocyte-specific enhancer factor 2B [Tetrabaena socialis]|eukprot:PNH10997.1 Myocyte-specific enhancer factor 2B [Tetrabaena socialis]